MRNVRPAGIEEDQPSAAGAGGDMATGSTQSPIDARFTKAHHGQTSSAERMPNYQYSGDKEAPGPHVPQPAHVDA